jgi:hypothetical protein
MEEADELPETEQEFFIEDEVNKIIDGEEST